MKKKEEHPSCQHCGKPLYRGFSDKCPHCMNDPLVEHGKKCDCPKDKKS